MSMYKQFAIRGMRVVHKIVPVLVSSRRKESDIRVMTHSVTLLCSGWERALSLQLLIVSANLGALWKVRIEFWHHGLEKRQCVFEEL